MMILILFVFAGRIGASGGNAIGARQSEPGLVTECANLHACERRLAGRCAPEPGANAHLRRPNDASLFRGSLRGPSVGIIGV